jgi:hypothetical protein
MRAYVTESSPEHIKPVALNMRAADVAEIWAAGKNRPENALKASMALSQYCKTIMIDDAPAAIFGVTPLSSLTGRGVPWLLGTAQIESIPHRFLKGSMVYLRDMARGFSYLENWVDARNAHSIAWLKWLGFVIMPSEPYGHLRLPFHRFYMENPHV